MLPLLSGSAVAQTLEGNDDLIPRDLVLRLIGSPLSGIQQELLIGQLPDDLPVDLPLPDGAKVVASVVMGGQYYRVLLDTPQSPDQVKLFYQEQLDAAGWQRLTFGLTRIEGFVPSEFEQTEILSFCRDTTGSSLAVFAGSAQESTDLQLNLNIDDGMICDPPTVGISEINVPMPTLVAPAGADVSSQGGGGSRDYWYSRANLETALEAESLMAHYGDQWEQAGWTRIADDQTDQTLWALWRLQDEAGQSWQGALSMTQVEGMPSQYKAAAIVIEL